MEKLFNSYKHIYRYEKESKIRRWSLFLFLICIAILFLPWTQNIRGTGTVTALRQEQRPQQINTIIAGKVVKWYIKEGDMVNKGDTILQLSEVKPDYLDPNLLNRTAEQLTAKKSAMGYYENKAATAGTQISALQGNLNAKMEQLKNKRLQLQIKAEADSMDMIAAINEWKIATLQYNRQKAMYDSGLVSLTQLETRNQAFQNANAKKISNENKWLATKQEIAINNIEFSAVQQEYTEKLAKAEGDRFGSLSQVAGNQAEIAKLENQYASYSIRNGMYYVIAPQSGQIVKARTAGIGEVVKEGEMLVNIVPKEVEYAVEMYVRPVDMPLITEGQEVRLVFDGFPAIVFSGWPQASYGIFPGIVSAVERDASSNGKFKILIKEDPRARKWPKELKIGAGANGIALLKNVPVWYELWRNINSFPPDYYKPDTKSNTEGGKK